MSTQHIGFSVPGSVSVRSAEGHRGRGPPALAESAPSREDVREEATLAGSYSVASVTASRPRKMAGRSRGVRVGSALDSWVAYRFGAG